MVRYLEVAAGLGLALLGLYLACRAWLDREPPKDPPSSAAEGNPPPATEDPAPDDVPGDALPEAA